MSGRPGPGAPWALGAALALACAAGHSEPPPATEPFASTVTGAVRPSPSAAPRASGELAAPAPRRSEAPSEGERAAGAAYVEALERVAARFVQHRGRCAELARSLLEATDDRERLAASATGPAHSAASALPELRARLEAATHAIADGTMACARNRSFAAARAKLFPRADAE